jgi:hypothetical protein
MMRLILSLFALAIVIGITGCTAVDIIKNNVDMCSVISCESLGIIDLAGERNVLIPDKYGDDPFCTIPGMCGPNIFYPYSQAPDTQGTATQ